MSPEVTLIVAIVFFGGMVGFGVYLFLKERKEYAAKREEGDAP